MSKEAKLKNERVQKVWGFIQKYWRDYRDYPSVREIGLKIGVSSTSLIHGYLDVLVQEKKIVRRGYGDRKKIAFHPDELARLSSPPKKVPVETLASGKGLIDLPNFGSIAAGIPLHLPDASFKQTGKNQTSQPMVSIPESYLPQGVKAADVFALSVEGDSMRDAMLTDKDIVIFQKISNATVKPGDIVAAWLVNDQTTTLKRFDLTERGIVLRPENPNYDPIFLQPDEVEIQGKLLAVLRFRY